MSLTNFTLVSLKWHIEYFHFRQRIQLDRPVHSLDGPFTLIQCFVACFQMQVIKIISCLITLTPQRKVRTAGHGVNSFWQVPPLHLRAHTPPQVHSESKIKRSTLMTGCKCENHTFPEEVPEMYKCKKLQFALVFWNQVADNQKNAFSEPCHGSHNLVCTWRPGTVCVMQFLLFKLVLAQLVYLGACSATRFTSKIAPPRAYLVYAVDATFHAEFSNDHQAVSIFV